MAVLAVPARRLCGREMHKFIEEHFPLIHYDLRKRLSSSLKRVGPHLTRTVLNKDESPVGNCLRASSSVAQESCHDSPRQGFFHRKQLLLGSACGNADINGRLQSDVVTLHSQGTTIVQETNQPAVDTSEQKNPVPMASARELKRVNLEVGRRAGDMRVPSAGTTSRTIPILKNLQQQGIKTDSYTFVEILKRCSTQKDLIATRQVHDCIIQSKMDNNPFVATTLLNVYIRCGRLQDARRVFDGLEKKTVVTWNSMIAGYAMTNHADDALEVFNRMRQAGAKPGALEWVKEVHSHAVKAELESDLRVGNVLIHMYARSGSIADARLLFDRLKTRDVITWTTMIGAYAESGRGGEAYRLFLQMQQEGFIPDAVTYLSILNASGSAGALDWVKEVHSHALKAGLESDLRVCNALVHMYAKSGSIVDARLCFDRLKTRDVITWNMMIGAYAESGDGAEAYRLFLQMQLEGFIPNTITYVNILNASASAGALDCVKEVHSHALKAGLESDLRVGNALVHMYAKSGSIDDARLIFGRMKKRDVVTWTTMIGGLAQHGCGHEALELFREMNAICVKPNGTTFVALLSACCHAGFVEDGYRLFLAMREDYGIEPSAVHCNCMVDLLGRAGRLEEAKLFIDDMPVEPVAKTWGALLGACRTFGNVELGELAAKELLRLEPKEASVYVLLSNIYAAAGKWDKVSLVRTMMQERGLRKEPGRSWIEVDNKIHDFVVGDISHPESKAIYAMLKNLTDKLKAIGYIPDTQLVLQKIAEEDKELALCSHSEKLAIAYGLMRTPHGQPIRVYKNLRVCSDCHIATKFISKVTGRVIIARDASRFHHFKDGMCSCNDYW